MCRALETNLIGHLGDGKFCVFEELPGTGEAVAADESHNRFVGEGLEFAEEL